MSEAAMDRRLNQRPGVGRLASVLGALLVLCAVLAAAALAASTNFVEPASSPEVAGDGPSAVAAADLDGDGDQDLAVGNFSSGDVTILRNAGSGNFAEPASSPEPVGAGAYSIVAADLDGDADRDLAVGSQTSSDVTILRNTGSGNFVEPASSPEPVGDTPYSVAAADLDGNGSRDLAVVNLASENVTILRNTGAGNFVELVTSPELAGGDPIALAAADLDGDADQDLAVANSFDNNISILRNAGGGNFSQPATSPEAAGGEPRSVAAADLDGDGDQDLAVTNKGTDDVTILRNTGAGNFIQPATSPEAAGLDPGSLAAADFDGDGDQDLAIANQVSDDVTILRNSGAGNFSQPASSPELAGDRPLSVAAADLDGDGDPDLALANQLTDSVSILRNR
jgi:hypothetical protein